MKLRKVTFIILLSSLLIQSGIVSTANAVEDSSAPTLGIVSLTKTLNVGEFKFDQDSSDFDIFTYLLLDVIGNKPKSAAWALADGDVALTAFLPTDSAFRLWVKQRTGTRYVKESNVYNAIFKLGFTKMEQVLLYHVVIGEPLTSSQVVAKSGVFLDTAQGSTLRIWLNGESLRLRDKDLKRENPEVILSRVDINLGNRQVAHPINGVLTPKN